MITLKIWPKLSDLMIWLWGSDNSNLIIKDKVEAIIAENIPKIR